MTIFTDAEHAIQAGFPERHFTIKHGLDNTELFSMERLIKLAESLPVEQIEWNSGDAAVSQDPTKTPGNGLSPAETIRQIENHKSWLVLKNIETDPEYKAVLDKCLDEVETIAGKKVTGICDRAGYIFVSSPGAVTPYHMDPEHNFLMQIRGSKTMYIYDQRDREVLKEEQIENTYYGVARHRNLEYKESFKEKEEAVTLQPGDALHVPIHAPHWVKNGDAVSISLSITFRSDQSHKAVRLHVLNARLRKLGLKPSNVGYKPAMDSLKDAVFRTALGTKKLIRG
ncbi:MAG: cupin-like domain-containing protein [Gammaproteobacteria bacterium]|nr:cupin-like domain-containing protein [Gammaproteobacteria bacterium]